MNALEKIELLERIGLELQARMSFAEIDVYFGAHGIEFSSIQPSANSKRIYAREVLAKESEEVILKVANELEIQHGYSGVATTPPAYWRTGYFRVFISHLSEFKSQANKLKTALELYAISAFVAHEDIEPSREWQLEIEKGLHSMDALAVILTPTFIESEWCDQEVGFAVAIDVLIIPIRKGLDPYGFIGKYQGIQSNGKTVRQVAESVYQSIVSSPKTRIKIIRALAGAIGQSTEIDKAMSRLALLENLEEVPTEILESLRERSLENSILKESSIYLDKLNQILRSYNIRPADPSVAIASNELDDIPF